MRDGGEPPIRRVLRPDHREEDRATRNLTEKEKRQEECAIKGADARERGKKGELWKNTE
jgi:hypothetical protein